jgi:putative ABC transport system permease protein
LRIADFETPQDLHPPLIRTRCSDWWRIRNPRSAIRNSTLMLSDFRFALHQLIKSPGFTATVILTLALGISACVTIFALIDSVLLRRYASYSERSVVIHHTRPPDTTPLPVLRRAWPAFSELKSFELLNTSWGDQMALTGEGEPVIVSVRWATQHYLAFHGNRLVMGRGFSPEEYASAQARRVFNPVTEQGGVAILAYELWKRVFGGRNDIVGRTVQLAGESYTVVGVATEGLGSGDDRSPTEVYFPGNPDGVRGGNYPVRVTGRF